jgi:hypothetical protein
MVFEPNIVAFVCNWCTYTGADLAGTSRITMAPNVRIIRLPFAWDMDNSVVRANPVEGVLRGIQFCYVVAETHLVFLPTLPARFRFSMESNNLLRRQEAERLVHEKLAKFVAFFEKHFNATEQIPAVFFRLPDFCSEKANRRSLEMAQVRKASPVDGPSRPCNPQSRCNPNPLT